MSEGSERVKERKWCKERAGESEVGWRGKRKIRYKGEKKRVIFTPQCNLPLGLLHHLHINSSGISEAELRERIC